MLRGAETCESTIVMIAGGKTSNALILKSHVIVNQSPLVIDVQGASQVVKQGDTKARIIVSRGTGEAEAILLTVDGGSCPNFFSIAPDQSSVQFPTDAVRTCEATRWCNGNLAAEDQKTVDTIRSSLAKNNCGITVWPTITRTCEADALILSRTIQLCLGDYGLTSLAPLASIPSLARLDAFNNRIVDVSPLAKLPALRFVYLSGNQITDPNTLVQLPKLRWLGLSNNPLSQQASIDALARKEGMFYLGLRQTERSCPADRKVAICSTKGNDESLANTISTWPQPQEFYYYHAMDGAHDDSVFFTVDGLYPQTLAEGDLLRIPGTVVKITKSGPDAFKVGHYWDVEGQY